MLVAADQFQALSVSSCPIVELADSSPESRLPPTAASPGRETLTCCFPGNYRMSLQVSQVAQW